MMSLRRIIGKIMVDRYRKRSREAASKAGRELSQRRILNERELKAEKVRQLCSEQGRPVPKVFAR